MKLRVRLFGSLGTGSVTGWKLTCTFCVPGSATLRKYCSSTPA